MRRSNSCLLLLVVTGGGAFFYIRARRHRLIEAEERIETLNRLLAEATKRDGEQETTGNINQEVEDGQFFRKILLQQLGIIRLVATQPTLISFVENSAQSRQQSCCSLSISTDPKRLFI